MKVVSRGSQRLTCPRCSSVLEYEWTDIQVSEYRSEKEKYYIDCPICRLDISVTGKIQPTPTYSGTVISTYTEPYYPYDVFPRDTLCASAYSVSATDSNAAISALETKVQSVEASVMTKTDVPKTLTATL